MAAGRTSLSKDGPHRIEDGIMRNLSTAVLALLLITAAHAASEHPTLTLVADTWCPVTCATTDALPGYATEITRDIFAAAGYRVSYSTAPWARAVLDTRNGRYQALIGVANSESPADLLYPQEPVADNINVFFVRANNRWQYRDIASLDGVIVGIANDYLFGEPFDSYVLKHKADADRLHTLVTDAPVEQGATLLRIKRIDSYLDDRTVVRWTLGKGKLPADLREAGELSRFPLYVGFSRKDPRAAQWAKTFDEGIRKMRANGTLRKILARYGVSDWKKK